MVIFLLHYTEGQTPPRSPLQPWDSRTHDQKEVGINTVMPRKTEFSITIRHCNDSFYSTHGMIQGHVSLKFEKDTVVDDLCVTLEGKATIRMENHVSLLSNAGYVVGDHTFLRMSQPIQSTMLPEDHLARRGERYMIPFNFIVPETLLPYACSHGIASESVVRRAHLLLPPLLGIFRTSSLLINDLGPKGTEVSYNVHARIRTPFHEGTSVPLEAAKRVRIIPMRREEPPVSIRENDPYYTLNQEKNVYRGTSTVGKFVGRLVAETTQLSSLQLPHPRADVGDHPTLTAAVSLEFYPASQREPPPQLGSITSKLRSFTFLGAAPNNMLRRPGDCHEDTAEHTQHANTTRLASYNLGTTAWVKHKPRSIAAKSEPMQHVPSSEVARTSRAPFPSNPCEDQLSFYTTSLQIPIRLPQYPSNQSKQKSFVPTFSSCIVSRAYSIELNLSYKGVSATSESLTNIATTSASISQYLTPQSHLLLRIPLQISVGTGPSSPPVALTSQSHVLRRQEDERVEGFSGEPARQSSAYSPNADAEPLRSGADQRTMLSETRHLRAVLSNPGTAHISRRMVDGVLDSLAFEERPPAYAPAFRSR